MFDALNTIYPINIHRHETGREHNGWIIPHQWNVKKALIKQNGKILFDGTIHPLAVAGNSHSYSGVVSKEELDNHIFYRKKVPNAYNYHCMNYYKSWINDWGFCVPYNIWKDWGNADYDIELETEHIKGEMLVGECTHQGELSETIIFNAHTCHPCQFNDDLSGVAVILALFKWLNNQKTRYTYKGLLGPEFFGSVFYLADLSENQLSNLKMGTFVEMVGIDNTLTLQQSFTGKSIMDQVVEDALKCINPKLKVGPFRTIVGNDEITWDSPGIEIPFTSISRCFDSPNFYDQYHTNEDDLSINSENRLLETFEGLKKIVTTFEKDSTIHRKFKGLVSLSNPKYDLYIPRPRAGIRKKLSEMELKLGHLQDTLPRYFNGEYSIFQLADKFNLEFNFMLEYIEKYRDKNLVDFKKITSLDSYKKDISL